MGAACSLLVATSRAVMVAAAIALARPANVLRVHLRRALPTPAHFKGIS